MNYYASPRKCGRVPTPVAVTRQLTGTDRAGTNSKAALLVGLAVTLVWPMKIMPSSKLEGSACTLGLLNNRMVEALLGCCGELQSSSDN